MTSSVFATERLLFTPATSNTEAIPTIFAFPNDYTVGITSLGYQVVWATLAMRSDMQVSRLFTDTHEQLPREPELLGFSMSWELDYVNILNLLESLEIPIRATSRDNHHPIVFGGGPVLTANPEPFADFFDVILLGDGENLLGNFINAYKEVRNAFRQTKLQALAQVPGIYVPSLYEVFYHASDGAVKSIQPISTDIPAVVQKQTYRGDILSTSTVVTEKAAWENIYMVEVVRSCPEMCRFCLASYLTLPFRTASVEGSLIPAIEKGLSVTKRIGLLGASVTQHPEFEKLLDHLNQTKYDDVRLSIASVRTNTVTVKLAEILAKRDTRSLTIAVESGSENLRKIINKKLQNDEIIQAAINAKAGGLTNLKLYGMVGIPGEEPEDLEQTVAMMRALKKTVPSLRLTFGCSTFVPKAHTPFQWFGVNRQAEKRLQLLQKQLKPQGIEFRPESYNWSIIQALLSRGDRRLSHLLELTRNYGDSLGSYRRAFKQLKGQIPTLDFYVHDNWSTDIVLPWNHLQGLLPQYLLGFGFFVSVYSITLTCAAAIFICVFFVQHNFDGSYAHKTEGWDYFEGAIKGSSYLELPTVFKWFSADIGYHNIHHLCDRIPNYNLQACHNKNIHLLRSAKTLRMVDIPDCFKYILWDCPSNRLKSIASFRQAAQSIDLERANEA